MDASEGMLFQAKSKIKTHKNSASVVAIAQSVLPTIPFPDDSYDAVMLNMVIHHLNDDQESNDSFKNTEAAFREVYRVLKPGGVIIVSTSLKHQIDAMWYTQIQPQFTWSYRNRFPSLDQLMSMLQRSGFVSSNSIPIVNVEWCPTYRNPEGPLYEGWRKIDYFWTCFPDAELNAIVKTVEEMKTAGTLEMFVEENDTSYSAGQMTIVSAKAVKRN